MLGKSGTGKELVSRAIHLHGPWKEKPFITIDCGALAPALIDSEHFGHVRGAFTGADHARQGLLASAQGGTVLLDEVAELPVELQSKLLRALQEHQVRAIGGNEWTRLEARIIAATNQDLDPAIVEGSFREDPYYRPNVLSTNVPPLRERKSDIPLLAYHFIDRHRGEGRMTAISADAMQHLIRYNWPGNVRELENYIHRAMVIEVGPVIMEADLPSWVLSAAEDSRVGKGVPRLAETERRSIMAALQATGGDRVRAAQMPGIGKTTIYRKIKEFGLEDFLPFRKAS